MTKMSVANFIKNLPPSSQISPDYSDRLFRYLCGRELINLTTSWSNLVRLQIRLSTNHYGRMSSPLKLYVLTFPDF